MHKNLDSTTARNSHANNSPNRSSDVNANNVQRVLKTNVGHTNVSFSKTLLEELSLNNVPNKFLKCYCILDEQSTTILVNDKVV